MTGAILAVQAAKGLAKTDGDSLLWVGEIGADGNANGIDGDQILLGPPFVVTETEMATIAETLGEAVERATAEVAG